MRVEWPRTRVGEKGVGSEAKVLVPGENERVSLEKTNRFYFQSWRLSLSWGPRKSARFANSGHLFVLPRRTLYSLYNTFTSMFSFLSRVLRSPMYVQVGEIKKVLPTREGHAQS